MRLEAKKYLHDVDQGAGLIADFTKGKGFADYQRDALLRSAVERQFEVIGEALAQLARLDEALAARVSEHHRIIAFRNILMHQRVHRRMTLTLVTCPGGSGPSVVSNCKCSGRFGLSYGKASWLRPAELRGSPQRSEERPSGGEV